jgi:S-DNA-T family DNA segregation ATPase FtsK/SpoIIIE
MPRKPTQSKPTRSSKGSMARKPAGKAPASRKRAPQTQPAPRPSLSPERKLDILGGVLALVGILTLLSLFSGSQGAVMGAWVTFLRWIAGWGAFLLPIVFIVFGVWLVLRRIDRLPTISPLRSTGLALLYLNLLTWMHFIGGGGWELARAGNGGGFVGGFFDFLLSGGLGRPGAAIILSAWSLLAVIFTLDISIPDFFHALAGVFEHKKTPRPTPATDKPIDQPGPLVDSSDRQSPSGFTRLAPDGPTPTRRPVRPQRPANQPAPSQDILPTAEPAAHAVWKLPALADLLDPPTPAAAADRFEENRARRIEETLQLMNAPGKVVGIQRGPVFTQFSVEPGFIQTRNGSVRVRVSRIVRVANDLALALATPKLRIQAPVPGYNYVGIEVPNTEVDRVVLREVMESKEFHKSRGALTFALGKDVSGVSICPDLAAMPHLLIAGTTGSGKSVCVNAILCCLLMTHSPEDLRMVLVDPKRVELAAYNGIPHLLGPVVTEMDQITKVLGFILREMDSRYERFSEAGARNIEDYNQRSGNHLPYLVVVIDELAELMMTAPDETERALMRLAQLARATGIHLIVATQRPSVNIVTGSIKANLPARIAFMVATGTDSRVILDDMGAEQLMGKGDMIYQPADSPNQVRLQGVYVSDAEIGLVVDYWKIAKADLQPVVAEDGSVEDIPAGVDLKQVPLWEDVEVEVPEDPIYQKAVALVRSEGKASISMLQRKLGIGYGRAARLIGEMENKGIIGPSTTTSQVREVLDYGEPPVEDDPEA